MSDTATEAPKKRLGLRSLRSADDVRRLLARLIKARLADDGTIDNETLRAVTQCLATFLKATEAAETEDRLEEIERLLKQYEDERN